MLSYPFFRRQHKPYFAHQIIDKKCIFVLLDLQIKIIFKIKFRNLHTS